MSRNNINVIKPFQGHSIGVSELRVSGGRGQLAIDHAGTHRSAQERALLSRQTREVRRGLFAHWEPNNPASQALRDPETAPWVWLLLVFAPHLSDGFKSSEPRG